MYSNAVVIAAMPNSYGGAVLYNSRTYAGTHLGTSYRIDRVHQQPVVEVIPMPIFV